MEDDDAKRNVKKAKGNLEDSLGIAKKLIEGDTSPATQELAMLNLINSLRTQVIATFLNLKYVYDEALKYKPELCESIEAQMAALGPSLVEINLDILNCQTKLLALGEKFKTITDTALVKLRNE